MDPELEIITAKEPTNIVTIRAPRLMPKIVVIESVRDLPENDIANILKIPSRYTGEF